MKCRLCGRIFKQLGRHLIKSHDMTPKEYYDLYMKKPYEEYCENPYCINEEENEPNETIFLNLDNGYQRHCCLKCSNQNPTTRLKSENTCIKRYNTINPMKVEKFKNKVSKSLQKTYEDPVKKEDINNRRNQTIKDRYKVKGILSVKELSDKAKKTNLERYGKESYSQTEEFNERITEFSRKVYGVDHFLSSPVILKIKEETNLKKRNVRFSFQDPAVKQKIKETNLKKRNVEYNCQDPEVANKISNSLKEFYEDDENRERVNQTKIKHSLERYGTDWPLQNDEVKKKSRETSIINFRKKVAKQMKELNLEIIDDSELIYGTDRIKIRCLKCDKEYINSWYNISLGYGKCNKCFPRNKSSIGEKEIIDFIESLNIKTDGSCYDIISPFELDIVVREKKIAIEYNGLYWHSDKFRKNNNYHLDKTNMCSEKGFRLIHIFEDEWLNKKEIIKHTISNILNCNNSKRIHARKCIIKEISPHEKNDFLNKFHLLGQDTSVIKLGAFHNDELISVMTFSHGSISRKKYDSKKDWELSRFCSNYNYHISGIASKLLTFFKRNYEWNNIYSYADLRWSAGDLYYKLGFEMIGQTKPDYCYFDGLNVKRIHRFKLRKRIDEPKDKTEWELRLKEGYMKIFDCGKLKFMLTKNKGSI